MGKDFRDLDEGMGVAVAKRTILRTKADGSLETWGEVADRVADGNCSLHETGKKDLKKMRDHIAQARILMSGRHLQHGDSSQKGRNLEVYSNCSTAAMSHLLYYLLLNGSGVGRCYNDSMMVVDWNKAPDAMCVISSSHADYTDEYMTPEEWASSQDRFKKHKYVTVEDSREGWAHAVELRENLAKYNPDGIELIVYDFSSVRKKGSPIKGMQNRPSSGPIPTMECFDNISRIIHKKLPIWESTIRIDHECAANVVVGGARRAARMSTKWWKDADILKFINIKKDAGLWSSNNSVEVDSEFWELYRAGDTQANLVYHSVMMASFFDNTGEPGFINVDKLKGNDTELGFPSVSGNTRYPLSKESSVTLAAITEVCKKNKYYHIVNPCGEITLSSMGAYCVIADVVPYFSDNADQVFDSLQVATRALIRTNLMDSVYNAEVARTNRIGVGLTGIFEFAWKFFSLGFKDLLDETVSAEFWAFVDKMRMVVEKEAERYAVELGVAVPHTALTIKPSGSVSKLFALTEGAHLPAMEFYLRWVQHHTSDPKIDEYRNNGYSVKDLVSYPDTAIVGFPTAPLISRLGLEDKLVCAGEASPVDQYRWLMLLEKHWLGTKMDNQISYTLKYDPALVQYNDFLKMVSTYQPDIKCCTIMPQVDETAFEYQPEEPVSRVQFDSLVALIKDSDVEEDVGEEHVGCENGACPVDFNTN